MKEPKPKHQRDHDEIQGILWDYYNESPNKMSIEWVYVPEVRNLPGFSRGKRTVDGWAMNCYPSNSFRTLAFEIKVSPSDFKKELKDPSKRKEFYDKANEFWFVVPWGMVDPDEVPDKCGLMYVDSSGNLNRKKQAQHRDFEKLPTGFVASVIRSQYADIRGDYRELEGKIKDWAVELDGQEIGYEDFMDHVVDLAENTHYHDRRFSIKKDLYEAEEMTHREIVGPVKEFLESRGHSRFDIPNPISAEDPEEAAEGMMDLVREEIDRDGLTMDELDSIKEARDQLDEIIEEAQDDE